MSYSKPDVYYNPDEFGLTIVVDVGKEPCYDYDLFVVWTDEKHNLYYGNSSGCSCSSPFEDFTSLSDLTQAKSIQEVHDALDECAWRLLGDYVDHKWVPNGQREPNYEWRETDIADAHEKISRLALAEVLF